MIDIPAYLYYGFLDYDWKIEIHDGNPKLRLSKWHSYYLDEMDTDPIDSFLLKYHTKQEVSNGRNQGRKPEFSES